MLNHVKSVEYQEKKMSFFHSRVASFHSFCNFALLPLSPLTLAPFVSASYR